jgi:ATP-binding cassette, subfamily B, bacterial
MVVSYYGRRTALRECRRLVPTGRDGTTARALANAARELGLDVRALTLPSADLASLPLPAVLHWRFCHFVVLERWSHDSADIVDPARGRTRVSSDEFNDSFTGVALVFSPTPDLTKMSLEAEPRWTHYTSRLSAYKAAIALALACSLGLQLASLAIPLMTAYAVDHVVPSDKVSLLPIIVLGVTLLALNQLVISNLRERILLHLKAHLDLQVTEAFVKQLLALPLDFFDRRGNGDLIGRVASTAVIREAMSSSVLSGFLDATFATGYIVILYMFDARLAFVVAALGLLHATIAFLLTRQLNQRLQRELYARAESYDFLAQTFSGIASLKASGSERRMLERWTPLLAREVAAATNASRMQAGIATLNATTSLLFPLLLLVLGTYLVLARAITLGEMFALIALASGFLAPIGSLVRHAQEVQRAGAHLDRVVDVLNADVEQVPDINLRRARVSGDIKLLNVSFSYDQGSPLVLRGVSLHIPKATKLAIVGPTGSGKSTLAKLLLTLYHPTAGEILFDDSPGDEYDLRALRSQFGVVLQEPALFNGSIRDNISLHDPRMPLDEVRRAAALAAIDDEISMMPLGYHTSVSRGGATVSGGQLQRIALAQAVARHPAILVLDEATSHLDAATEARINARLRSLECTQIVVAHRLSTVADADNIVVLRNGEIVEQGRHRQLVARGGHYAALVDQQLRPTASVAPAVSNASTDTTVAHPVRGRASARLSRVGSMELHPDE